MKYEAIRISSTPDNTSGTTVHNIVIFLSNQTKYLSLSHFSAFISIFCNCTNFVNFIGGGECVYEAKGNFNLATRIE